MAEVSAAILRDAVSTLERKHPKRIDVVWVQRHVRVGHGMAIALLLDLCAKGVIAVDLRPRGSGWTVELPRDALRAFLDQDCPDISPVDEPHRPVGQVEPLAVDHQVHPSTVAQTSGVV